MREGDDPALLPEPEPESPSSSFDAETIHQAIRRVVAEILCHDNARLTAECVALVSPVQMLLKHRPKGKKCSNVPTLGAYTNPLPPKPRSLKPLRLKALKVVAGVGFESR